MKLFNIVCLVFCIGNAHAAPSFDWSGLNLRLDTGVAVSFTGPWQKLKPVNVDLEPFVELGFEYGWVLDEHLYLGAGMSWFVTYPRNFKPARGFFEPPVVLWWLPLTYAQVGYVFDNGILLSAGLVYVWAVDLQLKLPLNDSWFFEVKNIVWLDRIFESPDYPLYGFDSLHTSVGVGFRF